MASPAPTDTSLAGFERRALTFGGVTRTVFVAGDGPAVIVMHEIPGLYPGVARFAERLVKAGLSVYVPSLVGEPGRAVDPLYAAGSMLRACVAREFTVWATGAVSPIVSWLRALARHAHGERGGPGVGTVGMCLTGGFGLAMLVDDAVVAPVLSQPSLPIAVTRAQRRDLGVDDATLARIRERARGGACVMGLRFTHDRLVPGERFERLREVLGDRFLAVEIDSGPGNRHGIGRLAHSVLVYDLVDRPGHPTREALDRVLGFLRERLGVAEAAAQS